MVIRALERRFGPLTEAHRARVLAFNASELEQIFDRSFSANSLSDVFA